MTLRLLALGAIVLAAGCSQSANDEPAPEPTVDSICTSFPKSGDEAFEIVPGLQARVLENGYGRAAEPGDTAVVHYTGWLYDESAADKRGEKFDSSVDRGDPFQFPLGAGRVIKGWDKGVECMLIGEKRELTIAPEMGYGDRGAGGVIPPGATLLFEVELRELEGPAEDAAAN
jgi:FKBP-type peptidyl-prolyl cis-trans isomerase